MMSRDQDASSRLTGHVGLEVTLEVRVGGILLGDRSGLRKGSEGE
jgi:hypothetical protein